MTLNCETLNNEMRCIKNDGVVMFVDNLVYFCESIVNVTNKDGSLIITIYPVIKMYLYNEENGLNFGKFIGFVVSSIPKYIECNILVLCGMGNKNFIAKHKCAVADVYTAATLSVFEKYLNSNQCDYDKFMFEIDSEYKKIMAAANSETRDVYEEFDSNKNLAKDMTIIVK